MPSSGSPQLWIVVTRPDNLPAALTAAGGLADRFPGGCRLILENSSWWQNARWEDFRACFASVHAFEPIAACRGLLDVPRVYRQFAARQRTLNALPFDPDRDTLLCLAGVTRLANAASAAFRRARRVLCLPRVLHDILIRPPGFRQYRFTTSGWLQNHFVEPLVGLERTLQLKPRINPGGDGVRLIRLQRTPEEIYDAVVVMSNTGRERPPGTGEPTHPARFPDLRRLAAPTSTTPSRSRVVFFGTPFLLVKNLPPALYIEHLASCLDFLRRFYPDADLIYRPHPAETTEASRLHLDGFRLETDLEVAELYFLRHFHEIEAVYSVSSTVSRVAFNAGLDAYTLWRCFPFRETQVRFFEQVMSEVPSEFDVRDLSLPPTRYAERRRASPLPDAGPTLEETLRGGVRKTLTGTAKARLSGNIASCPQTTACPSMN